MNIIIRKGIKEDLPQVLGLIKELALYERSPESVTNTVADMENDGFGERPIYELIVAEDEERIVGIAIFYIKYSTWRGKGIYLDDILVTESCRGKGIGNKLFEAVIKFSKEFGAKGLWWQVLEWNEPAINFYNKFNAELDGEWINGKLNEEQLRIYEC
jgi:GNAT superfamily N-acetyltransferase